MNKSIKRTKEIQTKIGELYRELRCLERSKRQDTVIKERIKARIKAWEEDLNG